MRLEGIHHVTCITGDAPGNVEFYAGVLGLRLVKKTVNQDDPTVYHLFYADELGSAGADITFFEYPGVGRGRAGDGMVHTICFRVASGESLDWWQQRAGGTIEGGTLVLEDPEGLRLQLLVDESGEPPLTADAPDIPVEHRLRGFAGVRAYASQPERSTPLLEALGFEQGWVCPWRNPQRLLRLRRAARAGRAPGRRHRPPRRLRVAARRARGLAARRWFEGGGHPTQAIDRFYFKSIYFREPSGVLFEIATIGPGFTSDEPLETLGESLSLPPNYEQYRAQVEQILTPLPNPRLARSGG